MRSRSSMMASLMSRRLLSPSLVGPPTTLVRHCASANALWSEGADAPSFLGSPHALPFDVNAALTQRLYEVPIPPSLASTLILGDSATTGFELSDASPEVLECLLRAIEGNSVLFATPELLEIVNKLHTHCAETVHLLSETTVVLFIINSVIQRMRGWAAISANDDHGATLRQTDAFSTIMSSSMVTSVRFSLKVALQLCELAPFSEYSKVASRVVHLVHHLVLDARKAKAKMMLEMFPEPSIQDVSTLVHFLASRQLGVTTYPIISRYVLGKVAAMKEKEIPLSRLMELVETMIYSRNNEPELFSHGVVKLLDYCPLSDPNQLASVLLSLSRKRCNSLVAAFFLRHLHLLSDLDRTSWWSCATAYILSLGTERPNQILLRQLLGKGHQFLASRHQPTVTVLLLLELLAMDSGATIQGLPSAHRETEESFLGLLKDMDTAPHLEQMLALLGASSLELKLPTTKAMHQKYLVAVGRALSYKLSRREERHREGDDGLPIRRKIGALSFSRILSRVRRNSIAIPELVQVLATCVDLDVLRSSRPCARVFTAREYILFCQKFSVTSAAPMVMELAGMWAAVIAADVQHGQVDFALAADVLDALRSIGVRHLQLAMHLFQSIRGALEDFYSGQDRSITEHHIQSVDDADDLVAMPGSEAVSAEGLSKAVAAYRWMKLEIPGWDELVTEVALKLCTGGFADPSTASDREGKM